MNRDYGWVEGGRIPLAAAVVPLRGTGWLWPEGEQQFAPTRYGPCGPSSAARRLPPPPRGGAHRWWIVRYGSILSDMVLC